MLAHQLDQLCVLLWRPRPLDARGFSERVPALETLCVAPRPVWERESRDLVPTPEPGSTRIHDLLETLVFCW
jgi:hypothetical protein